MSAARRPSPAGSPDVRTHNTALVLTEIARSGPVAPSRAQVAASTGLTRATVSTLVDELAAAGLVEETAPAGTGRPGRPGSPLRVSPEAPLGLGLSVDVDGLGLLALAPDGAVVARTRRVDDLHASRPGPVLRQLAALVRSAHLTRPVAGVGVAVSGLVDPHGVVRRAPNLPHWDGVDVAGRLGELLGLPVRVDNDANLAALAHRDAGPGPDFVFVSGETGVGAGLVLGGEVFRGGHGFAGEFGHVVADPRGPACGCGGSGCVEQYASETVLARAAGVTPDLTGPDARAAVVAAVTDGRRGARPAVARAGRALGVGLASLINLVDVQEVVLGGIYPDVLPWLEPALVAELDRRIAGRTPRIHASTLGDDGPLLGAAMTAVQRLLDDPLGRVRSAR